MERLGMPVLDHRLDMSGYRGSVRTIPDTVRCVDEALRALAPPWVRTAARAIDAGDVDALWPAERAAVARAVAGRRAEFASGRALLRELIGANVEIPVGIDRRPDLPSGVVGTLAHDRDVVVGAVATRASCCALGIDVEVVTSLVPQEAGLILRPDEHGLDAGLAFVLKEAVYKAWSSLGGPMLEHHDVAIDGDLGVAGDDGTVKGAAGRGRAFTARVRGSSSATFTGRYATVAGRHVALVVVGG